MHDTTKMAPRSGTSHQVETTLGSLNVHKKGQGGEVIVLWPSIFTDHRIYDGLVAALGKRYGFLLVDGPGHGQSGGPTREFAMRDCAKALSEVMDHFGLGSAVVGGTSWGGMTAAELAASSPERVKALVLMNTPMDIGAIRLSVSARLISFGARWMLAHATFRNGVARSFFSQEAMAANPDYMDAFHAMLKAAEPVALSAAVRTVLLRGEPLMALMATLRMPTLVIAGKDDAMYPVRRQAEACLSAPMGHFEAVVGKHISVIETPGAVADIIRVFMEKEVVQ